MKLIERFKAAVITRLGGVPSSTMDELQTERDEARKTVSLKILQLTSRALGAEKERDAIQQEHGRISDVLAGALQELDSVSAEYAHFKVAFKSLTKGYPLLVVLPPHVPLMAGDYYVDGGRLHPLDPYLVGQMAGPFALFIRKLQ